MPKTRKKTGRAKMNQRMKASKRRQQHEDRSKVRNTWTKDVMSFLPGEI